MHIQVALVLIQGRPFEIVALANLDPVLTRLSQGDALAVGRVPALAHLRLDFDVVGVRVLLPSEGLYVLLAVLVDVIDDSGFFCLTLRVGPGPPTD